MLCYIYEKLNAEGFISIFENGLKDCIRTQFPGHRIVLDGAPYIL